MYGKEIKVTASKHNSVSMPKEGDVSHLFLLVVFLFILSYLQIIECVKF